MLQHFTLQVQVSSGRGRLNPRSYIDAEHLFPRYIPRYLPCLLPLEAPSPCPAEGRAACHRDIWHCHGPWRSTCRLLLTFTLFSQRSDSNWSQLGSSHHRFAGGMFPSHAFGCHSSLGPPLACFHGSASGVLFSACCCCSVPTFVSSTA